MYSFVIFVSFLGITSADIGLKLRQAAGTAATSYDVGQQSVNVEYAPTVFQDTVVDGAGATSGARSFAGAGFNGVGYNGAGTSASYGSGDGIGARLGSVSGTDYDAGYQAGLRAGATASSAASAGATSTSNARFGGTGAFSGATAGSSAFGSSSTTSASANTQTKVRYAAPVVQKHFYYHVAPEDTKSTAEADTLTITPRKHYKIIFIKAPSANAYAGAKAHAASRTEEKTIVYVLVNKPSAAKAGSVADASSFSSGKPEVYFIKYQGKDAQGNVQANSFAGTDSSAYSGSLADAYTSGTSGFGAGFGAGGFADGSGTSIGLEANDFVDFGARSGVSSASVGSSGYNAGFTAGYSASSGGGLGVTPSYDGVAVGAAANAGSTSVY